MKTEACPNDCPTASYGTKIGSVTLFEACPNLCTLEKYGTNLEYGKTNEQDACPYDLRRHVRKDIFVHHLIV